MLFLLSLFTTYTEIYLQDNVLNKFLRNCLKFFTGKFVYAEGFRLSTEIVCGKICFKDLLFYCIDKECMWEFKKTASKHIPKRLFIIIFNKKLLLLISSRKCVKQGKIYIHLGKQVLPSVLYIPHVDDNVLGIDMFPRFSEKRNKNLIPFPLVVIERAGHVSSSYPTNPSKQLGPSSIFNFLRLNRHAV